MTNPQTLLCHYRFSDGTECETPILRDAQSPSGYTHATGRYWCHWASPMAYGPQESERAFVKRAAPAAASDSKVAYKPGYVATGKPHDPTAHPHDERSLRACAGCRWVDDLENSSDAQDEVVADSKVDVGREALPDLRRAGERGAEAG